MQPREQIPHLREFAETGCHGEMYAAFITKTFPNHYSLITGLYEESHGIVGNVIYDPIRKAVFTMRSKESYWWDGGEPLWVTAEKQGKRSKTLFWPGSDVEIRGVRPTTYLAYNGDMPFDDRADMVAGWLSHKTQSNTSADQVWDPPAFSTLYFEEPDSSGHRYGPFSSEAKAAVRRVDAALGRLKAKLGTELYNNTNIVIVADHGMAEISPSRVVYLVDDCGLNMSHVRMTQGNPVAGFWAEEGVDVDSVANKLINCHPNLTAWKRDDAPARYHFRHHFRIPQITAAADVGWSICESKAKECYACCGTHGGVGACQG